ncbi:hypothetical protein M011DRAFT_77210 [Sporormia fimetaria CBS 119925]|uniref:Carbohydrate-binding module family 18 protein n=1 Tax=Sporormia fimetaria CBS 119925 TaxID=1340428 RepID=A0A6A6V9D3_9PLEO|nr:hypothetical protein M011DRAFT_77210 [Sporormia fimetaria CBS 119925]
MLATVALLLCVVQVVSGAQDVHPDMGRQVFVPFDAINNATMDNGEVPSLFFTGNLVERQSCPPGYGYCSNMGRCCPSDHRCCPWGCIPPGSTCCPGGGCLDSVCCGSRCMPAGSQCCANSQYCEAGNHCFSNPNYDRMLCCTDNQCTAYVENGQTKTFRELPSPPPQPPPGPPPSGPTTPPGGPPPSRTPPSGTTTPPPGPFPTSTGNGLTRTGRPFSMWTYTVTWEYLFYYYTYWEPISASTLTYSTVTETTTVEVAGSDAAQALSQLEDETRTMEFPTPPEATELVGAPPVRTAELEEPSNTPSPDGSAVGGASLLRGLSGMGGLGGLFVGGGFLVLGLMVWL